MWTFPPLWRWRNHCRFLSVLFIFLFDFLGVVVWSFSDTLYFEVKENSPPHTYVGRIPTKSGFTYRFNDEPLEFLLDPETGVIVTSGIGTDRESKSLYNLVILSSSPTYPVQVKIRVLDVNDNVPYWPGYINVNLTFSESAPVGTKVILDNAIDLDEGDLQYQIDYVSDSAVAPQPMFNDNLVVADQQPSNSQINLPFKLNYNSSTQFLYLEVSAKLDRELHGNYLLNITAYDEDYQSSSAIFNVKILDSNDNAPIFDQSDYVVGLNESAGKDVPVLQVRATDADEEGTDNSRITYSLNSDDFKIDPNTGLISTAHDPPITCGSAGGNSVSTAGAASTVSGQDSNGQDFWRVCVFTVFAQDHGVPRQDGRAFVTAKIYDTNNHVPIIKFRYFSKSDFAHVDENAINGSVVAAVSVVDFDQGSNGQTWLQITAGNELNHFRLESIGNSHIIKVNGILDREKIPVYNLTVMAQDRGMPPKMSTDNLIIMVQDHNDHGPKFDKEIYETAIVESQYQVGAFVYALHATDLDEGINSQISYSISGANSHFFKVDSNTGLITTEKYIDREAIDFFELRVTARDGGSSPKWAHALLKIKVLDINDETPVVQLPPAFRYDNETAQYEVDIDEGIPLDLDLIVRDSDLGANGTVDVDILYDYGNLFKIDPESIKLITTQKLDYETCQSYRVVLIARDRAPSGHQLSSMTTLVINVKNIDDRMPKLYPRQAYSFIPISAFGSFNYSVVIYKLQIKENDFQIPMHFVINSRDEVVKQLFYIDNHGEMRFKNNFNVRILKNVPKSFVFDVECLGCRPGYNVSQMNVFLVDTDLTGPGPDKQVYDFAVEENAATGTIVGELDVDVDRYQLYTIQGDLYERFSLSANRLKTNRPLDRETKNYYKLQVIAMKSDHFFYIDINVRVLDINDCDPYFPRPYQLVAIDQDVPLMYTIIRLVAFDPDLDSAAAAIEYRLVENPFDLFVIERDELKLAKSFDGNGGLKRRASPSDAILRIKIRAVDSEANVPNGGAGQSKQDQWDNDDDDGDEPRCNHGSSHNNELTIFVLVKPVFRTWPRFAKRFHEIFLSESTPVNEKFFKLDVHNLNLNNNNDDSFSYSIKSEPSGSFDVLPSGHLYVKNQLDREKIDIYLFDVQLVRYNAHGNGSAPVDTCKMLIHIKDINDNRPVFSSASYRFAIPENVSTSFFIGQIRATDADAGPNSQVEYSLVNSYYSSYLNVDPVNGYLWTSVNYDREQLPHFEVVVQATDQPIDEERFTSQALIRIDILDINDNRPIFEMPANVTSRVTADAEDGSLAGELLVSEMTPVNSTLARFKATDLDSDSTIVYALHDSAQVASIDPATGVLRLTRELDREQRDSYELLVEAADGKYRSFFRLTILVEDVNDCQPMWINFDENEFRVPENISIGSEIFTLNAVDHDLGNNALFHFAIENYSGNHKYFDILNQKLVVINRLDYEKMKVHQLNISLIETITNRITSTKNIRINLIDINDCQPMFIRRTETEVVRVPENIDIGTKLTSLQAYDCDVNDVLTYEIVSCNTHYHTHRNLYQKEHESRHKHDSNNCPLKLNTKTGEIININNLDREVIESINLQLSVKDSVGHSDKMKVIFIIEDINDESPVFISPNKILISEETLKKPNAIIGNVKAVDLDLGANSAITYKLEHSSRSHLFDLDRFSGIIKARWPWDPAMFNLDPDDGLHINVSATDGGGLQTNDLIRFILEPNKPYLETVSVHVDINENLPIGTEVTRLQCHHHHHDDHQDGCRFHLVNATDRNFEVDSFTGIITAVDLIDREMLDKRLLEILIISQENLQIMQVHIIINDQNDNPPYLTNTTIVVHLKETTPPGQQIFDLSQMIADEDTNNKFDFQIINCSAACNGVFVLNRKTGIFTLQSELDCEKVEKYRILFGVSDGIYLLTSLMEFIVDDENDNKPYFNRTDYVFWVKENTERGTIIGQVQAFDADKDDKNLIYSIVSATRDDQENHLLNIFSLDSRNGQLTLSKRLDYEQDASEYSLLVKASDGKFESAPVQVTIKLINLPDNPPMFESSTYRLEIMENKIFYDILCLKAYDADLMAGENPPGENDNGNKQIFNLTYHLHWTGNSKANRKSIDIDRTSGCISVMKPLDRETTPTINLTASVDDGFSNATALVFIKVLDENDNHPIFDPKTPKTLKVVENVPIDTIVYTFSAFDCDETPNSYIKYELIKSEEDDGNCTAVPFVIGPIDGQLKVTGPIDREQSEHFDVTVRATDYGFKHTDFKCRIDVEDIIDNSPLFATDFHEMSIFENVSVGQIVFKLEARDRDPTDEVNYKIISGDVYGHFHIEDDQIVVAMNLNYEEIDSYNLKINAIDKAGNIDTTNIKMNVLNVLDEKPIFPEPFYRVNWFENRIGTLGQFEARSQDKLVNEKGTHLSSTSNNHHLNYLLLDNFDDCFQLNSTNAVLKILKPIDREALAKTNKPAIIELKVMAIDSLSRLSNEAKIYVTVVDVNDNPPTFLDNQYEFHLQENQLYDLNTTVGAVRVFDPDQDDVLRFGLDSPHSGDKFSISSRGEIYLQSSLIFDREEQSTYEMHVVVDDSKHSIRAPVKIIIRDLNDCLPKITKLNNIPLNKANINSNNEFKLKIPLIKLNAMLERKFPLIGMQINDCDDGLNGQIQVRINDDSLYNILNIDAQTGVIKSDHRNVNLQREMLLQISTIDLTVSDLSDTNQLSVQYLIHLEYTEHDSYREQNLVGENFVKLFVSESTPVNESLYRFQPTNPETINEINIYAGDVYSYFAIVNNALILAKPLDFETMKSYDLYLQAINHQKEMEEFQYIFIRVNVINENDNPPAFLHTIYNASIPEEEENVFVTQVWANDIDSDSTKIRYRMVDGENLPFQIDSDTGHIWTTSKIDREMHDSFRLTVSAEDQDGLASTVTVLVAIEDKNDNPPRFTHLLRTNISEATEIGSFIIQVASIDRDIGNNSRVTYNLLTETNTFRIDANDGSIMLIAKLDRETKEEYYLTVSADDGSWKSQTTVTLYVLDENDCTPKFQQNRYQFNVAPESLVVNHSIGQVVAVDQDKAINGLVSYRLKTKSKHFGIDSATGNIFMKQTPRLFELEDVSFLNHHILTVIASDEGFIPRSSEVDVHIRCGARRNQQVSIVVPADLINGTSLYTSNAMIRLLDHYEQLFQTRYHELLFEGQARIRKGQNYSLAIDKTYEIVTLNLSVIGNNQFAPVFIRPTTNSTVVPEGVQPGKYLIKEMEAVDPDDEEINRAVHYSFNVSKLVWNKNLLEYLRLTYKESYPNLFKKNLNLSAFDILDQIPELNGIRNPFELNETTGEFYLHHYLDYEIITGYSLLFSAKDRAWYSRETTLPFDVWVEDIDDFIGYNLIDSDKLYHSSPKPDPMSIGVMVVIFFFIILILVISTSFFVYHNQKKRLSAERKVMPNATLPYNCQFSRDLSARNCQIGAEPEPGINNHHRAAAAAAAAQMRLNSSSLTSHHNLQAPPPPPPPPLPLHPSTAHHSPSSSGLAPNSGRIGSIRKNGGDQAAAAAAGTGPRPRLPQPPSQPPNQPSGSLSSRMLIKPDIVAPNRSVSNSLLDGRMLPTVASSIYTQSNSENYTDNYSNILASAEHYDLENASSIAPSDIDIVYHYKGYRNRDHPGHNIGVGVGVGSNTSSSSNHHQNKQHHAPLSRLSPSVSELSSAPHILTLQDLSPQTVPPPQPPSILHHHHRRMHFNSATENHKTRNLDDNITEDASYAYSGFDEQSQTTGGTGTGAPEKERRFW